MEENAGENAIAEAGESLMANAALILSLAGFLKALFGDEWKMPFLGAYREKVPGLHWQEG